MKLNFSKSGVSTSLGRRGATINLNSKGTDATVGLPGSGMSYRRHFADGKGYYIFLGIALALYVAYLVLGPSH